MRAARPAGKGLAARIASTTAPHATGRGAFPETLVERCTMCQYYDRQRRGAESSANAGQCRRQAPALSPLNQKSYMIEGVWPTVRDDDWCGEWKALVRRVDPARITDALASAHAAPSRMPPPRPVALDPLLPMPGLAASGRGDD
jgi:hypothetical protein